jgi:hypothetical protein
MSQMAQQLRTELRQPRYTLATRGSGYPLRSRSGETKRETKVRNLAMETPQVSFCNREALCLYMGTVQSPNDTTGWWPSCGRAGVVLRAASYSLHPFTASLQRVNSLCIHMSTAFGRASKIICIRLQL